MHPTRRPHPSRSLPARLSTALNALAHPSALSALARPAAPAGLPALLLALVALAFPTALRAQEGDVLGAALSTFEFREVGPAIMGGRVTDIAAVERDPSTFYVGFASGGLWKTTNDGMSWTPLFDDQPTASIGAVTLAPSNPNVVWVGTGAANNRQSSPWGAGVFKSVDGGQSWQAMGLTETRHIGRIVVHPRNPDIVYVAAAGHLWGPNEERGVYRSTDGGESWQKVLYVDEHTGAIDLVMDPGDPKTLFAALYQRRRTPWGFSADGAGSGIYRTLDGGESWEELTEGLPEGDKGRIGLGIYRGEGASGGGGAVGGAGLLVYALIESDDEGRGLYRSEDRGETWQKLSDRNPRPMYFSLVRIDPSNPERVYLGGVSFSISDDGGRTWHEGDGAEGIHVDHHALWIDPNDPDHLLLGNDGGIASSRDGGATWRHHNNLAVGQFYDVGLDLRDPYYICGGLQDNSSWCGPSQTLNSYGIRNSDWYDVSGGDGFRNVIDPSDPMVMYTESQGGNMSRYHVDTGESARIRPVARPTAEDTAREYRFNWNTPIHISWHDPATIYVGGNHLLRSRDRGVTWEEASPDVTRRIDRDTLPIMGVAVDSTTLSLHDGVSDYGTIVEFGESPLDAGVLYVGTDDGVLQVTRDGGASWSDITENVPGLGHGMVVSAIEPSRHVPGRVYVAYDGHLSDDYAPHVYVSEDYGEEWREIVAGLPSWSVNVVREHPRTPELLFLGNEVGLYVSVDGGERWVRMRGAAGEDDDSRFPTVPVDDIEIHPRENDLVVATHGRSIWIVEDITPLEHIATRDALAADTYLFPVRRATLWSRAGGWPFHGDRYAAPNPPDGARIRYWLAEDVEAPTAITAAAAGSERTVAKASGPQAAGTAVKGAGQAGEAETAVKGAGGDEGVGTAGDVDARTGARADGPNGRPGPDSAAVTITILDASGRVVRTLDAPGTAGLHEVIWDLRRDPPYEPEERGDERRGRFSRAPRGPLMLPGSYTVRLEAAAVAGETEVVVRQDPRIDATRAELAARQDALRRLDALAEPLHEAERAAEQAEERIGAIRQLLEESADEPTALIERADTLEARLDAVRDQLDEAGRGGRLQFAIEGISARPTADQLWQIDEAWEKAPEAIEALNAILTDALPALEAMVYLEAARPEPIPAVTVPRASAAP